MSDAFTPTPEDKFTFGLWTVGNRAAIPSATRSASASRPCSSSSCWRKSGPTASTSTTTTSCPSTPPPPSATGSCATSRRRSPTPAWWCRWRPPTSSPTRSSRTARSPSNDPKVRAFALQKTMRAIDLGVELGAKRLRLLGRTRGHRDRRHAKTRRTPEAVPRGDQLPQRVRAATRATTCKFALEPKPNEPRGDIYLPTVGAMLGFIPTLDHPEMVGVNPEVAHETMAGLNFLHAVAQAWTPASSSTSTSTTRSRAATTRISASARRTSSRPSSWSSSWRTSATAAAATSTRTPTAPRTRRA